MSLGLDDAFANINKAFGKGALFRLGDEAHESVDVISTGSIGLDKALGIGGVPRGRIIEIFGPESSGKSTLALHIAANAQRVGTVLYVDTEHSIDPTYAAALGVDINDLLIAQPNDAEQAFEIIETLVDSGNVSAVIIDSVAALACRRELEGDYGDSNVGLMARLMSQAMRKLVGRIEKTNTLLVCINQLRMKVGVVYGSPEVTPGGVALKYYSSMRLDIRRIETEKQGNDAVGNRTRVKVVKNKCAPPLKVAEFSIDFGRGISRGGELIDLGLEHKIIARAGSWLKYGELQWQGRANAITALSEDPDTAAALENKVAASIG